MFLFSNFHPHHPLQFEGYDKDNTISVDGFLYEDEDIDKLADEGKLRRARCMDCQSYNCQEMSGC